MTKYDRQTRWHAGTYGVGVSWKPRRRAFGCGTFLALILLIASIGVIVEGIAHLF